MTLSDPGTGWKKTDASINVSGEDTNSGIAGYIYYLNGATKGTDVNNINTPIQITLEGTNKVKVQTKDKAGNVSNLQERTIKIDKTGPSFNSTEIEKSNVGATSFKVSGYATDSLSGIAKYTCTVTENGNEILNIDNTIGEFEITNRRPNVRYEIRIVAIDNAGNQSTNPCTGYVRTVGELKVPNLNIQPLVTGAGPTNGYYRSGIKILLADSASSTTTTATSLHYEIVNQNNETTLVQSGEVTNYATFEREGNYKIRVWAEDDDGNQSAKSDWTNFGIDTASPTQPSIRLAGTAGTNTWYKSNITATITPRKRHHIRNKRSTILRNRSKPNHRHNRWQVCRNYNNK